MPALRDVNRKVTPQKERARADQVKNHEGGYVFAVSDKTRLERFLILGTDGGTYYVGQREFTKDAVDFVTGLIKTNEELVLNTVVEISDSGRAYRNSPAIFTIALLMVDGKNKGATRAAFDKVVRTSTHLFEFAQYIENLGGWGRAKRSAVANWYENKEVDKLAYQLVKYRQRDGWTHRDLLRLSHPTHIDSANAAFALRGEVTDDSPTILFGYKAMQAATTVTQVVAVLRAFPNLPWETIPTEMLNNPEVWKALFDNGQLRGQNAIRNVRRLQKIGAFNDMVFARDFATAITDEENIAKARLHPINYLNALTANEDRHGSWSSWRGVSSTNSLNPVIVDALNDGFHAAFKYVEPSNKRTLLALDVSSSMSWTDASGLNMSCAQAGAAMAMTIARREPYYAVMGFTNGLVDLNITPKQSFSTVMKKVNDANFGGTDCALPMMYAKKNKLEVDTFVVITDSETWGGRIQPFQALKDYRKSSGIDARLAVIGMAGSNFTIADPTDAGSMDFVGFDTNAPRALADFSAGRI